MLIEILGTGCAKCEKLAASADAAAKSLGVEYELVKVKDLSEIMQRGVMMTPALVIDGEVKAAGKIPGEEAIKKMLSETSA